MLLKVNILKKNVGNFGVTGCHSFYATKNLTTGEGGMITTNSKKLANRLRIMRLMECQKMHGKDIFQTM